MGVPAGAGFVIQKRKGCQFDNSSVFLINCYVIKRAKVSQNLSQ